MCFESTFALGRIGRTLFGSLLTASLWCQSHAGDLDVEGKLEVSKTVVAAGDFVSVGLRGPRLGSNAVGDAKVSYPVGANMMEFCDAGGNRVLSYTGGAVSTEQPLVVQGSRVTAGDLLLIGNRGPRLGISAVGDSRISLPSGSHSLDILDSGGNYLSRFTASGLSVYNDIVHGASRLLVRPGTSDASDTSGTVICGGGGLSTDRGAYVAAHGNEFSSNGGWLLLRAGTAANARIDMVGKVFCDSTVRAPNIVTGAVKVDAAWTSANPPADYVFEESYELTPLSDVESFVLKHKHLEGIPSAKEQIEKGVDVYNMMNAHLEKIEELTLYAIQAKKERDEARSQADMQVRQLKAENDELKKRLARIEAALGMAKE